MLQDNQKKVQFCRELSAIVYEILSSSKELISVFEELAGLYKPKSREEADKFYSLRFDLPDSVGLLCDLRKIDMPDDDEFYDAVAPLRDTALDVAVRMVSANVIINDVINMYVEPHDDDMYIHLYLTVMKPVSNSIRYMCEKLDKLHKEISQQWPDLLVQDDDTEEEEEPILPGEVESFQLMRNFLIKALTEYTKAHNSERISGFVLAVQDYLEAFANGIEPDKEFDFSFVWETGNDEHHETEYIGFHFESEMIQVSSGGSIYDKPVGSDSYTNWDYSIWLNGWDEDNDSYRFSTTLELVRSGAKLSIESPDGFIDDTEDK
ncbi:hypothetical protein [Lutispora sp.]|uniref:hypothetical protein n=1 Tax=Lutispora sp. TaxID=2828727 RepID=UPI002B20F618|nr:hypothetical protein [Lutispora sp.]MEA4961637.1 hypothetical protein [Lutispora sp.]